MQLNIHDYRDKVLGYWLGKNIGGTLGAPFECKHGVFPVEFYTQDTHGEPLPNDDLDLQLVWLNAIEKYHCNLGTCSFEFTLEVGELNEPRYDLVLQISSLGHPSQGLIPVTLLNVPAQV